jgi:hypothetical protein
MATKEEEEEEELRRLREETERSNESSSTTSSTKEDQPEINTQDKMIGGLGLGGAAYAAQTGSAPAPTPQGPLSPFAQQVASNDAARLAAQNRPALIGTGSSTSGVTNPRLVPGTNIVPTGQPPAVTATGGPPATTGASAARSASDFDFRIGAQPSRLARFGGPGSLIYGAADLGTQALTGTGLSERIGEGLGGAVGNLLYPGAQDQPAFTEAELQQSRDNLSLGAQMNIMQEDAEASVAPLTEVSPLQAGLGALDQEITGRESNIANNQVELAKGINELGTVSDAQKAVQSFMDERAERSGTTATDVIKPFQDQAQLTSDLFTDPNTAIGQFVPRATFTLPDGTIIQEDEGGNRREISAEQLRQFEQDMASLGQPSVVGLGRGGDAGVIKSFDRPMGPEETQAALGGMTLNQYSNAPAGTPGASGLRTDPQGRMITPTPQPAATQPEATQPAAGVAGSFAGDSYAREARLRANERQPGESQTERDTRVAQSRTTAGQTEGLSFDDARRRAKGELAAKGIRNPSASQVNSLAQGMQSGEPERLQALEDKRNLTQSRIDAADAQLAQAGIVPTEDPVLDPETGVFMQLYSDGIKRIKGNARAPSPSFDDIDALVGDKAEGAKSVDTVRMTDRDGKPRDVPKGDVQEALKNGYKSVGEDFTPNI